MDAESDVAARAEAGEADAQFALARMLLSADTSTQDHFSRAVSLVESASAAGHAAATEMLALFEAMAVARPQSWERAFDLLQLAAEQGSDRAQRQLKLLRDPVVEHRASEERGWSDLRKAISLDLLLSVPDRRAVLDGPRIGVIEGFASTDECHWLMERARDRLKAAVVFDERGRELVDASRTNKGAAFQLADMDLVIEIIRARIATAMHIPVPLLEPTQVLHYSVGQEFKPHHDFLAPGNPHHRDQLRSRGQRIATFLVYLNDDFEGGETEFSQIGLRYRGKAGDAIFWANCDMEGRPDPMTLHAGLPPTSGEKWILSQWIRDRGA
jgi:hypothetical protein